MENNYKISEMFIYPVKSLGGISVTESIVTDRGFKYDRRWMLIDEKNIFLSQRKYPQMALIKCEIDENKLKLINSKTDECFYIGLQEHHGEELEAYVWDDKVMVQKVNPAADEWFSNILGVHCSLVYMPDFSSRKVDNNYAQNNEITSLSDGYPFLIVGQASLDDLNLRLEQKLPVNRFRPNFVFTGGTPFEEDGIKSFQIGDIKFYCVKPCSRCVITTVNQDTADRNEEPLRTLSSYRLTNNKIMFGMNLIHSGTGVVHVGDELIVTERK